MEQPEKPPISIKSLNVDMTTLPGRYRWALLILEGISESLRIKYPTQPQSLNGYEPRDLKNIMLTPNLSSEDQYILKEHRKWRANILGIEGMNERNLRYALKAINILDDVINNWGEEEIGEAKKYREILVCYIRNEFGVEANELGKALHNPFVYARHRCQDLAVFNLSWRDPVRNI